MLPTVIKSPIPVLAGRLYPISYNLAILVLYAGGPLPTIKKMKAAMHVTEP